MSYGGITIPLPMGQGGLHTDDAHYSIPPTKLTKATNVELSGNSIQKAAGSHVYNNTALGSEIISLHDWWPDTVNQRLIAATASGSVYRDIGDFTFNANTAIATDFGTLTNKSMFVEAGSEDSGENKKLFFFSGSRQLQYIDGDATSFTTIANPATDWATDFPTGGVLHRGYLFAFGNSNSPHSVYASPPTDHTDFVGGTSLLFNVFPGEGDGFMSGHVYKGRMFLFKKPFGVYLLNDTLPDASDWYFQKISTEFGVASPHSIVEASDDLLVGNSANSITSLKAVEAFGDVKAGDILSLLRIENFIKENTWASGVDSQQSLYYEEKKQIFYTFQSGAGESQNRMLVIDLKLRDNIRATFSDKDQASCLAIRKDITGIGRPIYGDTSGNVYIMDQEDRDVNSSAYTGEFQIPYTDFGFVDPRLAAANKIFQRLEVEFRDEGAWNLSVDVFIDHKFKETINFPQALGDVLGTMKTGIGKTSRKEPQNKWKKLHGQGRVISFRCYNSTVGQNFNVARLKVGFKVSDERQTKGT